MKTPLLDLVLNETALLVAEIAQHFRKYPLQRIVAHLTSTYGMIAVVTDVEGSAIEVTGVLGGIAITTAQFGHIIL